MNKEKINPGKYARTDDQLPTEDFKATFALIMHKIGVFCRHELPVVLRAVFVMAMVIMLAYIKWISDVFAIVLTLGAIIGLSFQTGVVWQKLTARKEK